METLENLQSRVARLEKLVEINAIINSSLDIDQVLEKILQSATEVMNANAASIMLLDPATGDLLCQEATGSVGQLICQEYRIPQGKGIAGWVAQHRRAVRIADAYRDPRFNAEMDQKTGFRTQSILCVPLEVKDHVIGVAQVINKYEETAQGRRVVPFTEEDEMLFNLFCHQAAIAIDNAQLHRSLLKQQRLDRDLQVAKDIQQSLLPQRPAQLPGLELAGYYEPAFQVGGDVYDYFPTGRNRLALLIGDVSGKGISAALYMARFLSELRALALQCQDPAQLVGRLNQLQCERSRYGMFITLIFGFLDLETYQLEYVQAGHPPLCRYESSGQGELLEGHNDMPIGIFPDYEYQSNLLELQPGQALLWYTDGIVEVRNSEREMIGNQWLCEIFGGLEPPAEQLLQQIADKVHQFGGQQNFYDDIAMLLLKRLP